LNSARMRRRCRATARPPPWRTIWSAECGVPWGRWLTHIQNESTDIFSYASACAGIWIHRYSCYRFDKNISLYMSGCSFVFLLPRSEMTRFDNCEICIKHMLIVMFFGVVWLIKNTNLMILLIDRQWLARWWGYSRYLLILTFPSRHPVISLSRRLVRSKPRAPPSQQVSIHVHILSWIQCENICSYILFNCYLQI
jgi:hypothetical protein